MPVQDSACLLRTPQVKQDIYQISSCFHASSVVTDAGSSWLPALAVCDTSVVGQHIYLTVQEAPGLLHAASAVLE